MSGSHFRDHGIILLASDHRDRDRLLHIFTLNHGIIKAAAFGAKHSRRRFGGNLEPYQLATFELVRNQDFYHITEVTLEDYFLDIRKDLLSLQILMNVSRILTLRPGHINKSVFRSLYILINRLNTCRDRESRLKYYFFFLIYYLKKEGVFPPSARCNICDSAIEHLCYHVTHEQLIFACPVCSAREKIFCRSFDRDVAEFVTLCLKPSAGFTAASFPPEMFRKVQELLLPLLSSYLHFQAPPLSF